MNPPDDRNSPRRPAAPSAEQRSVKPRRATLFPLDADLDPSPGTRPPRTAPRLFDDDELRMPTFAETRPDYAPAPRPANAAPAPRPAPPVASAAPATAVRPREAPPARGRNERIAYDPLEAELEALEANEADLYRAERLAAPRTPLSSLAVPSMPGMGMPPLFVLGLIALLSIVIIVGLGSPAGQGPTLSRWSPLSLFQGADDPSATNRQLLFGGEALPVGATAPVGDYNLRAAPSLSVEQIDRILASYGSPAAGTGEVWYRLGQQYEIDPAFAVAFFIMESSAGTAKGWAGNKPDGTTTHNVGNIICAGYPTCYGRFRDYPSWEAGIADWYRLIDVEYLKGRGHRTVADIIPVYAPSVENDVDGYVSVVQRLVDQWRAEGGR